jgi:hypothetical protein
MSRPVLILAALAVLAVDIFLYGRWTNRWTPSLELEQAVARLQRVPMDLGDWHGESMELSAREIERAEIAGYLHRCYKNHRTGTEVTVLLLCGRAGPMSVHTPDICYRGAGYRMTDPEKKMTVPVGTSATAPFWAASFIKEGPLAPSRLRIYWAWNAVGSWDAAANPRMAFAGRSVLYKLYVVRQMTSPDERLEEELCNDFFRQALSPLAVTLFPSQASPSG